MSVKIRPVSDLRNHFTEISKQVHETNEPVFLTKNGFGDMVVLSMEAYENLQFQSEVYFKLHEAEKQAELGGNRFSSNEVMSNYILDLRKLVGHRTLIQCAASIIVIDTNNRILLGRRNDNNMWGYSGGSVEIDEKVEDCAIRELQEEMGLIAEELEFFYINSGLETHYIYPNGDEVSNIEIVFLCRKYHGEIIDSDEMKEIQFFEVEDINLDMISPPIRSVIKKYI